MDIFEKNLKALKAKNSRLAEALIDIDIDDVEILYSKTALPILKYKNTMINSMYDPEKEASIRVNGIDNLKDSSMIICFGFGMGYEIRELCKRVYYNPAVLILAVVCNLEIFKMAMKSSDLTDLFALGRLLILDGTREDLSSNFLKHYASSVIFTDKITHFMHPAICKLEQDIVKRCATDLRAAFFNSMVGFGNAVHDTLDGVKQIIENIEIIAKSPDLTSLKDHFKGIPAICVATGPSLDKNIEDLRTAVGKAVIFAGESNIMKLRNEGIKFDAASIIERVDVSYDISIGKEPIESEAVFFGDAVVKNVVFEQHKGKNVVVFRSTTVAEKIFSGCLGNLNDISIGSSVAHMNLAIAHYLGFSPIILVGQDLAYGDDGRHHAGKTFYDDEASSYDEKNFMNSEIYVRGINDELVRTTNLWKFFLDIFEMMISEGKIYCIDATEGGAYIPGTKVMTLKEAIDKYCSKELNMEFRRYFKEPDNEEIAQRKSNILQMINDQIENIENSQQIVDETISIIEDFNNKIDNINMYKEYMAKQLEKINENYKKLTGDRLFSFVMQPIMINYARESSSLRLLSNSDECRKFYDLQKKYYTQIRDILNIELEIFKEGRGNI